MSVLIPILTKAVGAGDSDDFEVMQGLPVTISIYPTANFGTDTGALVKKNLDGTYDPVPDDSGVAIELSATKPHVVVKGMGTFRLEFTARTAAIGATKQQYNR